MRKILSLFFQIFLNFAVFSNGWDQILTHSFQRIFPDISEIDVWSLTFHINRQTSTKHAKNYLNKWLDEKWPNTVTQNFEFSTSEAPPTSSGVPETSTGDFWNYEDYSTLSEISSTENSIFSESTESPWEIVLVVCSGEEWDEEVCGKIPPIRSSASFLDSFWEWTKDLFFGGARKKRSVIELDFWDMEWYKIDTTTPTPWKSACLSDKEYARNQALNFLDHRETLKMYIRYIFKVGQLHKLIDRKEAEKVRKF
ncbi:hypothetical protein B9Z55_026975 [Caenorhabditis nigoni]|uniref:F-box associated domain-containing protein n=1 Tax=Caenorhabditis nigoni TaxID=1611254 RepID=A0A2G5SIC2_9PELO|nr:hypothetical protein B9Z55_026975 [Caenorhabditis nigoni]